MKHKMSEIEALNEERRKNEDRMNEMSVDYLTLMSATCQIQEDYLSNWVSTCCFLTQQHF